jgi:hypothetical protein
MSDLNARIKEWRDAIAVAMTASDLDELEDHLRQTLAAIPEDALSFDERFLVATHRLGAPQALVAEFARARRASLWRDRAVRMKVLGIACLGIGTWVALATLYNLDQRFANHLNEWLPRADMIRFGFVLLMTGLGSWSLWRGSLSAASNVGSAEIRHESGTWNK